MCPTLNFCKYKAILENLNSSIMMPKYNEIATIIENLHSNWANMKWVYCNKKIDDVKTDFILLPWFDTFHSWWFEVRFWYKTGR